MNNEKRIVKGYKVKPSIYKKAMQRAKKEKGALANLLENVVMSYAYGLDIKATKYDKAGNEEIEGIRSSKDWPKFITLK